MSAHPLTTFVYETFGQGFGDLLLAGYGAQPAGGRRKLYLTESEAGVETDWVIELVAKRPPCGGFVRSYQFLSQILPFKNAYWESLYTFLKLLNAKLPAPDDEDLSKGVLETDRLSLLKAKKLVTWAKSLKEQQTCALATLPPEFPNRDRVEPARLMTVFNHGRTLSKTKSWP
jgi:hypothetical protein